jgi:L-methionine (R)-S-oxide reductase
VKKLLEQVRAIASGAEDRGEKAREVAAAIQSAGRYRWVGVYDVGPEFVSIIAYSGPSAPAYPQFPVTKGLTGSAVREKKTVVVGDVRSDPRYLKAFGSTLSEIIIPVLDESGERVLGTIDVESERPNAFSREHEKMLKECARAALPLWVLG